MGEARSALHRKAIAAGTLALKPGWVRLSLPWYATPDEVEFLLSAVEFLADHGEAFVPLYRLGWRDGVWHHVDGEPADPVPLTFDPAALLLAAEGRPPWATCEVAIDDADAGGGAEALPGRGPGAGGRPGGALEGGRAALEPAGPGMPSSTGWSGSSTCRRGRRG